MSWRVSASGERAKVAETLRQEFQSQNRTNLNIAGISDAVEALVYQLPEVGYGYGIEVEAFGHLDGERGGNIEVKMKTIKLEGIPNGS